MSRYYAIISFIAFVILFKLILWLRIKKTDRGVFIFSFLSFFSIHDRQQAPSKSVVTFLKFNNIINILLYVSMVSIILLYLLSTDDVNGLIPTKQEAKDYKVGS